MSETLLFSRRLAAQSLSISIRSLDHLIAKGQIKSTRLGSKIMVHADELKRFAKKGLATPICG